MIALLWYPAEGKQQSGVVAVTLTFSGDRPLQQPHAPHGRQASLIGRQNHPKGGFKFVWDGGNHIFHNSPSATAPNARQSCME